MEFVGHIFLGIFIALAVFVALTCGFMLLMWFIGIAVAASILVMMRSWFMRWRFLYWARDRTPLKKKPPQQIIEVDYRDISDEE